MQLFIDSADVAELRAAAASGLVDGVTTNPSLIAKSGRKMNEAIAEICAIIPGPVSAEAVATDVDGMLNEGRYLARIASNVVVKLPLTENGLRACSILSGEGIRVNVTLCFSAVQAMLAAKAGAYFISPFIGRLDDKGVDGMQLIRDIRTIYDNYGRRRPPRLPAGSPYRAVRGTAPEPSPWLARTAVASSATSPTTAGGENAPPDLRTACPSATACHRDRRPAAYHRRLQAWCAPARRWRRA